LLILCIGLGLRVHRVILLKKGMNQIGDMKRNETGVTGR